MPSNFTSPSNIRYTRSQSAIVSRTLWFTGIGESALAEQVQDLLDAPDPTVAPLAGQGKVRLRITARGADEGEARARIDPVADDILGRIGEYYFGEGDETLTGHADDWLEGGAGADRFTLPGDAVGSGPATLADFRADEDRIELVVPQDRLADAQVTVEPQEDGTALVLLNGEPVAMVLDGRGLEAGMIGVRAA